MYAQNQQQVYSLIKNPLKDITLPLNRSVYIKTILAIMVISGLYFLLTYFGVLSFFLFIFGPDAKINHPGFVIIAASSALIGGGALTIYLVILLFCASIRRVIDIGLPPLSCIALFIPAINCIFLAFMILANSDMFKLNNKSVQIKLIENAETKTEENPQ